MPLFEIIIISIGLAMDAFAVSIGAGTSGFMNSRRARFRISFHFGLFQFMMPVIGWFGGSRVQHLIQAWDHWIALALLGFVGFRMIRSGFSAETESYSQDPSRGSNLILLSIATSIDALAIGLSLAILQVSIWYPSVMIGVITAGLSLVGISLGKRLGETLGKRMEVFGGLLLFGIGLKIVFEHLFA